MISEERSDLARQASRALAAARSTDDLRQVWRTYYRRLGHRMLGRLLLRQPSVDAEGSSSGGRSGQEPADTEAIDNELSQFARWPGAFTVDELLDFAGAELECQYVRRRLLDDQRFLCLDSESSDDSYFIPKRALFRWFVHLNLRLAQACQARLGQRELALAMSSLLFRGRWSAPPPAAIDFGGRFGLCGSAWTSGQYVFPIARVLAFAPSASARHVLASLADLADADVEDAIPAEDAVFLEAVEEGLSSLSSRQAEVVLAREGIRSGRMLTLEEIGAAQGVTRERVRQIEERAWGRLHHHLRKRIFVAALLRYVIRRRGSLVVSANSTNRHLRRFVCKAVGVPQAELDNTGLMIIGASSQDVDGLESLWSFPDVMDAEALASRLELEGRLSLAGTDLAAIGEKMARYRWKSLNKAQKVYLVLREIGRPAHYSEVTDRYERLFPADSSIEHNIHAILSREAHGVVWIGVHGTYALEEWGYEHPSKGLHDAVTEIVEERHRATGKPVPFTVIAGEIGKYRRVVKPASLTIAAHCNHSLQRVSKDSFLPRAPGDEEQEEITTDELDRILREFEARSDAG